MNQEERREAAGRWLKRENGQPLSSVFFKRGNRMEYLRPGSTFRRVRDDKMVETACMEWLGTDAYGIPHVRFRIAFSRSAGPLDFDQGTRMLALKIFAERYRERVAS